jgi:hypothetical protein
MTFIAAAAWPEGPSVSNALEHAGKWVQTFLEGVEVGSRLSGTTDMI